MVVVVNLVQILIAKPLRSISLPSCKSCSPLPPSSRMNMFTYTTNERSYFYTVVDSLYILVFSLLRESPSLLLLVTYWFSPRWRWVRLIVHCLVDPPVVYIFSLSFSPLCQAVLSSSAPSPPPRIPHQITSFFLTSSRPLAVIGRSYVVYIPNKRYYYYCGLSVDD